MDQRLLTMIPGWKKNFESEKFSYFAPIKKKKKRQVSIFVQCLKSLHDVGLDGSLVRLIKAF